MEKKIKVILSTFGPLHLIKSAEYLCPLVDIRVIQGWIPSWWNHWLLKPISKYVGYDLNRTIKKRTPVCLNGKNRGLLIPDFLNNAVLFFMKKSPQKTKYMVKVYHWYGKASCKYIRNADIFHVRSGSGRGGAIEKARKCGMKILVDHSIAHPLFMEHFLKDEYQKNGVYFDMGISNQLWSDIVSDCNAADILLVNSFFVRNTFISAGYDADKIRVVYLGVRKDFFSLKKKYTINGSVKILFTGGFGFRKGAEYVLRAMQELERRNINYVFTVVGNYTEAYKLIEKYPIKNLNLVGFVPQDYLKEYLADSDIYLFPSLSEGCASSGMEALASGLPVIATAESGFPIIDNENGIIVKAKDVDAIVEKIIYLKNNENVREFIGKSAAKMICEQYTWENYAENICHIYNEMI